MTFVTHARLVGGLQTVQKFRAENLLSILCVQPKLKIIEALSDSGGIFWLAV